MLNIEDVRACCTDEQIVLTNHLLMRMRQRNIRYEEVKEAIKTGEIIEQYPTDYPFPSCLINSSNLHIVCGMGEGVLYIITAYRPSSFRWENDGKGAQGEKTMKCGICKAETEKKLVSYTEDVREGIVVIRRVPAHVCTECGNIWYNGSVIARLEAIINTLVNAAYTEVAIVNYSESAA